MREHLFRGFHPDINGTTEITLNGEKIKGEWVEGSYFSKTTTIAIETEAKKGITKYKYFLVLPETVCEYSNLTDKNGKKIFEGDIVECYRYANGKNGELVFENLVVVWDDMDACFALAEVGVGHTSYRYNEYQMDDTHEFEIIGNIFENPELLK